MNLAVLSFTGSSVSTERQCTRKYMTSVIIGMFSDEIDTARGKIKIYSVGIAEELREFVK